MNCSFTLSNSVVTGTMVILDKLLGQMKAQGSRVLILSQMSHVLDITTAFFRPYSQFLRPSLTLLS